MDFRTVVDLPRNTLSLSHQERLLLMGSCFTENMGRLLVDHKFSCDVNPFGVLYNPASLSQALRRVLSGIPFCGEELFFFREQYHSYMHHGSFSDQNAEEALAKMNARLLEAHRNFSTLNHLIITWGTSWVYQLNETGQIVSNCHKVPDEKFTRRRLSVQEIVDDYRELIREMKEVNPSLKIIWTVSPIRHLKDGMHGNQLSKATLLLAVEELQQLFPHGTVYFPSYEIVLDDLRDYRFYADDMLHPSPVAIRYIWNCFAECFFGEETLLVMKEIESIVKSLNHKPFRPQSAEYSRFLGQILLNIERLKEKYPNLELQKELDRCHTLLNQ